MILSGHPTGNPNSHQAFKSFADAKQLYAICIPWIPNEKTLQILSKMPFCQKGSLRLSRRHFDLPGVKKVQGRIGEIRRLISRVSGAEGERLSYQANDWVMKTSCHHVGELKVSAVHGYEDCSLLQFRDAKRLSKSCIYDMPIGYYPAWQSLHASLANRFFDWIGSGAQPFSAHARLTQKKEEMDLADLVVVPSTFVAHTVREWHSAKRIAIAPYGVDVAFWSFAKRDREKPFTFIYAGACSVRKGVPLLLEAWEAANLSNCRLVLVGSWYLNAARLKELPKGVVWSGPVDRQALRNCLWDANCLVAPTYFEGRALIIGEAMATGVPVITTTSSGCDDLVGNGCGSIIPPGDLDALICALRWAHSSQDEIASQGIEARRRAEVTTWEVYRNALAEAVAAFV